MEKSRTSNSLKNMVFGIGGEIVSIILGFVTRTVFIWLLSKEYLGVSGLFTNVLSILSLANLGFDTAIVYSLYKPLAEGDMVSVKGYMKLFRKVYAAVGVIVFALGMSLMPFLPSLIKGKEVNIPENLYLIYFLFLLQSSVSYFFSYKRSLLIASQQTRVISIQHTIFMVIRNVAETVMLLVFRAYIPALIAIIACQIGEDIRIAYVTDKIFPMLRDKELRGELTPEQKAALKGNVGALLLYKISGTVITSTDNILITKLVGLIEAGLYSNYTYIVGVIRTVLDYVFNSMKASVGNYNVTQSKEENERLYYLIFFTCFWLNGFCSVCLAVLLNPFITLWRGADYTLNSWTVLAVVANFYTAGMQFASTTYREVTGTFRVGKYRPLFAAVLNLGVSIVLALPPFSLGVTGILLGTIISRLCVYFWLDPWIIHKRVFEKNVGIYFLKYLLYAVVVFAAGAACIALRDLLPIGQPVLHFIVTMVICLILPNLIFLVLFFRTKEFAKLAEYAKRILGKLLRRRR